MASFVTLEDYEAATQTTLTSVQAEAVNFGLEAACAAILRYLGVEQLDVVTNDVFALNGGGSRGLLLPYTPVTCPQAVLTVNQVNIGGTIDTSSGAIVGGEDVTDWSLSFGGILYRTSVWTFEGCNQAWPFGYGNVLVDYDHGYTSIPFDIRNVAIQSVRVAQQVGTLIVGITSETIGPFSYSRSDSATSTSNSNAGDISDFESVLSRYRLSRIPVA